MDLMGYMAAILNSIVSNSIMGFSWGNISLPLNISKIANWNNTVQTESSQRIAEKVLFNYKNKKIFKFLLLGYYDIRKDE